MAFEIKYRCTFETRKHYTIRVELMIDEYGGAIVPLILDGDDPVTITRTKKDGLMITTGCKLNVINTLDDLYEFANLHQLDQRTVRLDIIRTDQGLDPTLLFRGYLIDDIFSQKLEAQAPITLAFNNGLAHLDRFYPAFLEDEDVYYTEQSILEEILAFTYLDGNIIVNSTLYEDNMSYPETQNNPMHAVYLNRFTFTKNDGEFDNANEILMKILKSYNAVLYEKEGNYFIERNIDRVKTTKTWWRYTPNYSDPYGDYEEVGFAPVNIDSYIIDRETLQYSIIPAALLYKLTLNYNSFTNLIVNEFDPLAAFAEIGRWHANASCNVVDLNYSNKFIFNGIHITKQDLDTWGQYTANAILDYTTKFTKDPDDETILTYEYKFWGELKRHLNPDMKVTFRAQFYITDGTTSKWIQLDVDDNFVLGDFAHTHECTVTSEEDIQSEWDASFTIDLSDLLDSSWDDHIEILIYNLPPLRLTTLGMDMIFGDFNFTTNESIPDNLITNNLNINKNKIIEDEIDLFDTLSWNFRNGKYRVNVNGPQLTESWTDETLTSLTLQDHLITNVCNWYNSVRNKFNLQLDIVDLPIDGLYSTTFLKDENDDDVIMQIDSVVHSVKNDMHNVKFVQYISDVNKRIGLTP